MAIQGSGAISFSDLAEEFGDTPPYSFSEFYRDGGLVPGVNSSVAASGAIRLGTFYNSVNELLQAVTANASINAQTIFGSDWGTNIPKRLSIPSGVTIGTLTIPTGMGGTLEVDVYGEVQGTGGSAGGGAGGHAIISNESFTLNVKSGGAVRGGGGGGGAGGTGGNGSYSTGTSATASSFRAYCVYQGSPNWANLHPLQVYGGAYQHYSQGGKGGEYNDYPWYTITVYYTVSNSSTGGAGGAGGRGRGYNQTPAAGSAGAAGGTNAGTGGTGGTGGEWGTAGATGNSGANGNASNGSAGSGGGAAGKAVQMNAGTVTVNNSGTINGSY